MADHTACVADANLRAKRIALLLAARAPVSVKIAQGRDAYWRALVERARVGITLRVAQHKTQLSAIDAAIDELKAGNAFHEP